MDNRTILILDDEEDILELLSVNLKKSSFHPVCFSRPDEFFQYLENNIPALIILDLMLPNADGLDICKKIKSDKNLKNIPIIMLTAKNEEIDKIIGLELGADDYITKPFSVKELIARIKTILRRFQVAEYQSDKKEEENSEKILIGDILLLDLNKYEVYVEGKKIEDITSTEFRILKYLAEKKGWVFSRNQILENLWGNDKIVIDRTIDVHIAHLREKLGKAGVFLKNIRGVGYKIEE